MRKYWRSVLGIAALLVALIRLPATPAPDSFRFVILGDRTGEVRPGVYEQVWREAAAEDPAFVLGVGDTIQGLNDATAEAEWREVERILAPSKRFPLYLAPGNHDIWSEQSEKLFRKYAAHPPHYSFDHAQAHFTILDNSRTDEFTPEELVFLEQDLQAHEKQPVKFIVSHRPSWLIPAAFANREFSLHKLARKYGVGYVIAGHVHQLLHVDLDGVTYLSVESAGGHLRASEKYEDGWFFGQSLVEVRGQAVSFQIKELKAPHGQGRVTSPKDWGMLGLIDKSKP
ncbi:MAG TPA: metallophosphoesterase [Bryobacteraceae bacterium]|nr:metallophosphoesterase [Bryobacteraceae bacterium]